MGKSQQVEAAPATGVEVQGPQEAAPELAPYGNAVAAEGIGPEQGDASLLSQIQAFPMPTRAPVNLGNVPEWVINGVLAIEQADLSSFEWATEGIGKARHDPRVSLGPAQIQVQRAAELDFPKRDFRAQPLTEAEFDAIVQKLEDPVQNVDYLVREMQSNYDFYDRTPGKSEHDHWCFAIARHKGGHGPVGDAQVAAREAGFDPNLWEDVVAWLPAEIRTFVERVEAAG